MDIKQKIVALFSHKHGTKVVCAGTRSKIKTFVEKDLHLNTD